MHQGVGFAGVAGQGVRALPKAWLKRQNLLAPILGCQSHLAPFRGWRRAAPGAEQQFYRWAR